MSASKPEIAYLCETDPSKTWAHSGGNTRIYNVLKEYVGNVTFLGESWGVIDPLRVFINKLPLAIQMRLRFRVHWLLSRIIARQVRKQLQKKQYDVLFCSYSFFCLSNLKLPYPILVIFTSDATFTAYKNSEVGKSFGSYFSISRMMDPLLTEAEKQVYRNADLLLWPSQWIKDSADQLYGLSDESSKLVHWGANIQPPSREELLLDNQPVDQVRLLLVGRDWFHKGGPAVYETLKILIDRGVNAHLTVVGCVPPDEHTHEQMTIHPQLDKTDPEQYNTFINLYKNSHFFVMPSYEAYGFAFCEAGAYGLPALCLRVGGVPIKDNVNGYALPNGSSPDMFADKIAYYLQNNNDYRRLRETTRQYYEEHLNWPAWADKVKQLIDEKRQ